MIQKLNKKKKSHGGLKFLAFMCSIGLLIGLVSVGKGTEAGQRILGNREERRVENTALTPRFSYAAAKLRVTIGSIYNHAGTTMDITTSRDVSIDRQSETATSDIDVEPTTTQIAPGVDTIPADNFRASWTEVLTKSYLIVSPETDTEPWTRQKIAPFYYQTELDPYYIPMIDDLMGFELRDMATKEIAVAAASGFKAMNMPMVKTPKAPTAVTKSYSYEMDMTTYRRALPILASRTRLFAPPDAMVSVTIGFDDVGLMRFADVGISDTVATTRVQELGDNSELYYHYTLEVTDILGESIDIDVPTNVVDESPAEIVPGTVI